MASIQNIGTNALLAFQRALATTGHNIANSSTEGYNRQRVSFSTREPQLEGGNWMGSGVQVSKIERMYDDFLAGQVITSQSATSRLEVLGEQVSRIDTLLARPESGLDAPMQEFFGSMQALSNDPSSIAARHMVLSDTETLVDRFHFLGGEYSSMRQDVNQELKNNLTVLNGLADAVANLNKVIVSARGASGGQAPNDLLDQRERLVKEIAKLIDVNGVEQEDGALNLFVGQGQALVIGATPTTFVATTNPSNTLSPDISMVTASGTVVITEEVTGGRLGGLLEFRRDYIDPGQNELGLAAIGLVTQVNQQHELGLDLTGTMGGNFFQDFNIVGKGDLTNSGAGDVSLSFVDSAIGDVTTSDYRLVSDDGADAYTLTRLSDGTTWAVDGSLPSPQLTVDGLNLTVTAGADAGDSFLIQPTRDAAESIRFVITDPVRIAAAGGLRSAEATDTSGNPINTGDGTITQASTNSVTGMPLATDITFTFSNDADGLGNSGFTIVGGPAAAPDNYVLYDPTTNDIYGKTFPESGNPTQFDNFGGLSFQFAGTPVVGDQFQITNNSNATGDNRNALSMVALQESRFLSGGTTSLQESYSQLVSSVGAQARGIDINLQSQSGLLDANEAALSSVGGVNLDEEAANLIRFQQAYQASAQVIAASNTLFDTLLNAVRG
ncbi:MAG: flagellar hook-associated protein FlgK [Candidatus Polarisedimenticolaceae bacterium]|nr:flagellar hook-associated protein FlgK [Candidatus Polarisedimenticolaceae bacterium]